MDSEDYQEKIEQIELDIQKHKLEIANLKAELQVAKSSLIVCQEEEFKRSYGISSEQICDSFRRLLLHRR